MPLFFRKEVQHKVIVHIFCQYDRNSRLFRKRMAVTQPNTPFLRVPELQKTKMTCEIFVTHKIQTQICKTSNLIPVRLSFLIGKQVLFTGNKQLLLYVDFSGLFNLYCDVLISKQRKHGLGENWVWKTWTIPVKMFAIKTEDGHLKGCLFFNPLLVSFHRYS